MTIFTLRAEYKYSDGQFLYLYDDPAHGVVDEQLVQSVTDVLATMMASIGYGDETAPHPACTLRFSDDIKDRFAFNPSLPAVCLGNPKPDGGGTEYRVEPLFPEVLADALDSVELLTGKTHVWLCEHLLDYFPKAPDVLVVSVEPDGWTPDAAATALAAEV